MIIYFLIYNHSQHPDNGITLNFLTPDRKQLKINALVTMQFKYVRNNVNLREPVPYFPFANIRKFSLPPNKNKKKSNYYQISQKTNRQPSAAT